MAETEQPSFNPMTLRALHTESWDLTEIMVASGAVSIIGGVITAGSYLTHRLIRNSEGLGSQVLKVALKMGVGIGVLGTLTGLTGVGISHVGLMENAKETAVERAKLYAWKDRIG